MAVGSFPKLTLLAEDIQSIIVSIFLATGNAELVLTLPNPTMCRGKLL